MVIGIRRCEFSIMFCFVFAHMDANNIHVGFYINLCLNLL